MSIARNTGRLALGRLLAAVAMLTALWVLPGCIHARTVEDPQGSSADPATAEAAFTPDVMFRDGAILEIQKALREKDYEVEETGKIDPATESALERFQDDKGLPKTGYPDHETIRRLGLDPKWLYKSTQENTD